MSEVLNVGPGLAVVNDGEVRLGTVQRDAGGFWQVVTDAGKHLGERLNMAAAVALLEGREPQGLPHGATLPEEET